jgi:acetyltransferase-like isoleucine patch superfamily enzyme
LGKGVQIAPNTVIYGPAKIGSGSFIGPNVVLGFPPKAELIASIAHRRGIHDMADRAQLIIGQDCIVRPGTCVYSGASVGDAVSFGHNVMVRENVQVGGHTLIGTNVIIDGYCDIGEYVSIQTGGYIPTNSKIEDGVFLGPHVVLTNDKYLARKKTRLVGPTIRKGASIGANSLLMPSLEIGERAVIGAHSLVLGNVPPGCIYAGVPARKLREVPSDWRISLLKT